MKAPQQTVVLFDSENVSSIYKMALDLGIIPHVACPVLIVYPKHVEGPFTHNETTAELFRPPEGYLTIVINGSTPLDLANVIVKSFTGREKTPSVLVFDDKGESLSIYLEVSREPRPLGRG